MAKAAKPLPSWRITLIRKKGKYLGRVEAPDTESAIKRAIEEFEIDEAHRSCLVAQPVEECATLIARRRRSSTRSVSGGLLRSWWAERGGTSGRRPKRTLAGRLRRIGPSL